MTPDTRKKIRDALNRSWAALRDPACDHVRSDLLEALALLDGEPEHDTAQVAISAAQTLVRAADRRVAEATKHEPAAREAIRTLESEREANALLTDELDQLRRERDEALALLTLAKCPECDGSGIYHQGDCDGSCDDCPVQCRFCFERSLLTRLDGAKEQSK